MTIWDIQINKLKAPLYPIILVKKKEEEEDSYSYVSIYTSLKQRTI